MEFNEKLKPLLNQQIEAEHWHGQTWTGKLIGYCQEPTLILEDENGRRTTVAQRVFRTIKPTDN